MFGAESQAIGTTDAPGQLNVPGKQCDSFGVDRTEVGVGKHHHQERLRCLENHNDHLEFTLLGPTALQTTPKYWAPQQAAV